MSELDVSRHLLGRMISFYCLGWSLLNRMRRVLDVAMVRSPMSAAPANDVRSVNDAAQSNTGSKLYARTLQAQNRDPRASFSEYETNQGQYTQPGRCWSTTRHLGTIVSNHKRVSLRFSGLSQSSTVVL
jgi:hypothetical protein